MKAILEFDFEKNDYDEMRFKTHLAADRMYCAISNLDMELRSTIKYDTNSFAGKKFKDSIELAELVRDFLLEEARLEDVHV